MSRDQDRPIIVFHQCNIVLADTINHDSDTPLQDLEKESDENE